MKPKTVFGLKLWNYMQKSDPPLLTERDLAAALKKEFPDSPYYQKHISWFVTGKKDPPMDFLKKCARFFKLDKEQTIDLMILFILSLKEIKIDSDKMKMMPSSIAKLIALILSGNIVEITDEACDKIIESNVYTRNLNLNGFHENEKIAVLKHIIDKVFDELMKKNKQYL